MINTIRKHITRNRALNLGRFKSTTQIPVSLQSRPSTKSGSSSSNDKKSSSSLETSFTFQLFLLVGAMGAGYTLGKSMVMQRPPADLFPSGSITKLEDLTGSKRIEYADSTIFRLCINHILDDLEIAGTENKEGFMNDDLSGFISVEDGFVDRIMGKGGEGKDKNFEVYPSSTKDVSVILRYCQDYRVPVYTHDAEIGDQEREDFGLCLKLDRMDSILKFDEEEQSVRLQPGFLKDSGFENLLNEKGLSLAYDSGSLSSVDLFFASLGIKLDSGNGIVPVGDNWVVPKSSIEEIMLVLPDGKSINLRAGDDGDTGMFGLATHSNGSLGLITEMKLKLTAKSGDSDKLIVVGVNQLEKFNSLMKQLVSKVDGNLQFGFVDNLGCERLTSKYGDFKSFGLIKTDNEKFKKITNLLHRQDSDEGDMLVTSLAVNELLRSKEYNQLEYYSPPKSTDASANINSGLIVTNDLLNSDLRMVKRQSLAEQALQLESNRETAEDVAPGEDQIKRDLIRRFKFGLDPNRVLNPDTGVLLSFVK